MYEQFNTQFVAMGKQFAESTLKAQQLALANFERIAGLSMKTMETRVNATFSFLGEVADVRDFDGVKAIWPKGVSLVKETAETMYTAGQEALGLNLSASEAMSQLYKTQFEAANDGFMKTAKVMRAK